MRDGVRLRGFFLVMTVAAYGCYENPPYMPPAATGGSAVSMSVAGTSAPMMTAGTRPAAASTAPGLGTQPSAAGTAAAGPSLPGGAAAAGGAPSLTVPLVGAGAAGALAQAPSGGTGADSGGTGADSGSAAPATGSAGADAAAGSMQCPMEAACEPLPASAATAGITACCADNGKCGTASNGGACMQTAVSDPQCPVVMIMDSTVPSCCTSDSKCGVDFGSFMPGCTSLEMLSANAGSFFMVPTPSACVPAATSMPAP
jgi:hypothetical protein